MIDLVNLETLLKTLCREDGMHICVHDISGILNSPRLRLPQEYCIHSRPFCDAAKQTALGFKACTRCKTLANHKAETYGAPFTGYCCYGIYKLVYPVVIGGRVMCIVYIGNLTDDRAKLERRLRQTCRITGANAERLTALLSGVEEFRDPQRYLDVARLVAGYIQRLYKETGDMCAASGVHWAVDALRRYIDVSYDKNITLRDAARLYHVNHQYVGRLFRNQIGTTFHEYLKGVRLQHAAQALREQPEKTVMEIALDCGFQNATYFNRVFREKYGVCPTEWRASETG